MSKVIPMIDNLEKRVKEHILFTKRDVECFPIHYVDAKYVFNLLHSGFNDERYRMTWILAYLGIRHGYHISNNGYRIQEVDVL